MTSFQRQLNLYDFNRFSRGKDRSGYYHEFFLRGKPELCKRILRVRVKGGGPKANVDPALEPDFYKMPYVYDDANANEEKQPSKFDYASAVPSMEGILSMSARASPMNERDPFHNPLHSFQAQLRHPHLGRFPQLPTTSEAMIPAGGANLFNVPQTGAVTLVAGEEGDDENLKRTIAQMQLNVPDRSSQQTTYDHDDLALALEVGRLIGVDRKGRKKS